MRRHLFGAEVNGPSEQVIWVVNGTEIAPSVPM
jgi:hypothetical protein